MKQEQQYIPIDLEALRLDTLKPFDIYLKTKSDREQYVLYSRKGANFTNKTKQNILLNKVSTIYITESDLDLYQQYVEDNLQYIIKKGEINSEEKSRIIYDSSKYLMKKLFENPCSEVFSRTKKIVQNVVSLILSDRETTKHLILITEYDYYTYTHSINVGIFGIAFAREILEGVSEQVFYDLGLGFFLHDIGKAHIPHQILNKKGPLNEQEWNIMKTHPEVGYKLLEQSGIINIETAIPVMQHHERDDGSGYPKALRKQDIHIYGKICAIADMFDAMTTRRCYKNAVSSFSALKKINDEIFNGCDKDLYAKFVKLFAPNTN